MFKRERIIVAIVSVQQLKNIYLFYGSCSKHTLDFVNVVKHLRRVLFEWKIHLIYGIGNLGLMGPILQTMKEVKFQYNPKGFD